MVLHIIGLGLADEKDITVKGLETVRRCNKIYLENYTSILQCSKEDLEKFYGKNIILADRAQSEQGSEQIVEEAKDKEIAFLVVGDPFSATTHIEMFRLAKEKNVRINIINNVSVLTAVGRTGLELYKFGKTTSIPFPENVPDLETPYNVFKQNKEIGLHTLFLLDLNPKENKFMTIRQAIEILEKIESKGGKKETNHQKLIAKDTKAIACARLGCKDQTIKYGTLEELKEKDENNGFGRPPFCLIIPGKTHFVEEEMLNIYKN